MTSLLRISPKKAPPFLASKWLHLDFLLETAELQALFDMPFFLFSTLGVQPRDKNEIPREQFFLTWQRYIETLQSGKIVQDADFRFYFTAVLTQDLDAVLALNLENDKEIIIPTKPLVQMQLHRFGYSQTDQKFRSQAFGPYSVSWGLRLSYPQLFQYPETRQVEECLDETRFHNAALFLTFRKKLRDLSLATPFVIDGKRTNVPIRIGKKCLSWINQHAELQSKHIEVYRL